MRKELLATISVLALITGILLYDKLKLTEDQKKERQLGVAVAQIDSLKTEQAGFLQSLGKYKHREWTKGDGFDYRVDERQYHDGTKDYKITLRYEKTFVTATGSYPYYTYEYYSK